MQPYIHSPAIHKWHVETHQPSTGALKGYGVGNIVSSVDETVLFEGQIIQVAPCRGEGVVLNDTRGKETAVRSAHIVGIKDEELGDDVSAEFQEAEREPVATGATLVCPHVPVTAVAISLAVGRVLVAVQLDVNPVVRSYAHLQRNNYAVMRSLVALCYYILL